LKTYGERITRYLQEVEAKSQNAELAELRQKLGIKRIMDDILPLCEGTLEGAERVSDIVQELRRFSSSQKEAPEAFALRGVIETATNWVFRGAKVSPELVIECDEDLCLSAKKGYVHQILVNLVQNAIDAMDGEGATKAKGSSLHIRCESIGDEKDQITLVVRDNGHGISEDDLAHIFEPFYTTRPIGQGTGLGLYVSYNLAEEMGGSLAGSNHEEGGACFTLTLPIRPKSSSSSKSQEGGNG
jgi:two-component system sensor histidine kinase HupT/HoxJ